ncbi:MAG TPA: hybrid sensor histidine kinase/response regulator [Kofleriaceae bacterium]|nr:hybrid sensor histidine kinase/response regulator [Kofleriaceae bacterium]
MSVRVLVADDESAVRQVVSEALRRDGFEVIEACDGDSAIAQAGRLQPDLALIDLEMGPTDGFDVVRHLKQRGADIHVAVISGWNDDGSRLAAFDAGADDFIAKPAYVPELLRRVHAAARTQRAYVDARQAREHADRLMMYSQEASALLAHDLNNGLAVALTNLHFLRSCGRLDADESDAAAATLRALQRMAGLVSNFVDISRLEDAALICRSEKVDVAALLREVVAIHMPVLRNDGSRLDIDCADGLAGTFDPALIERVLHNLVGNAVRYVQPGGLVRVSAVPLIADGTVSLALSVANTGPAIPREVVAKLFSKYGAGTGTRSQRGMGLYFCRLVAEGHGGTIDCEPTDAGPRFVIRLPQ